MTQYDARKSLYIQYSVYHPLYHFFFFNDTATTEIYTLSLHDALPIFKADPFIFHPGSNRFENSERAVAFVEMKNSRRDRKSTRLNSSHSQISYAVFCLKKKIRAIQNSDHRKFLCH